MVGQFASTSPQVVVFCTYGGRWKKLGKISELPLD
jgi:hypothetical protein